MSITSGAATGPARPAALLARAPLLRRLSVDRRFQFWAFQLAGWSGLCVVTFLSLTLWYNTVAAVYVQHTVVQAALGLAMSLGMRRAFRAVWSAPPAPRLAVSGLVVVAASLVWTALRIETFTTMTGEAGVWSDFGGWYFASLLVMLSWALAYHAIRYYQLMMQERARAGAERMARLTAERAAQEAQLRMLRYQLNPHFLFNTLNSIASLVETGRGAVATEMIGELSRFLRTTLHGNMPLHTNLAQEAETLRLYLAIEQKRFGDRLSVHIDVPPDAARARLPSLLLQPLVENTLKHAVARTSGRTHLVVCARRSSGMVRVEVSDAGDPIGAHRTRAHADGIGLSNVRERLEAEFAGRYVLRSNATAAGWRTVIEMPYVGTGADPQPRRPGSLRSDLL